MAAFPLSSVTDSASAYRWNPLLDPITPAIVPLFTALPQVASYQSEPTFHPQVGAPTTGGTLVPAGGPVLRPYGPG